MKIQIVFIKLSESQARKGKTMNVRKNYKEKGQNERSEMEIRGDGVDKREWVVRVILSKNKVD